MSVFTKFNAITLNSCRDFSLDQSDGLAMVPAWLKKMSTKQNQGEVITQSLS